MTDSKFPPDTNVAVTMSYAAPIKTTTRVARKRSQPATRAANSPLEVSIARSQASSFETTLIRHQSVTPRASVMACQENAANAPIPVEGSIAVTAVSVPSSQETGARVAGLVTTTAPAARRTEREAREKSGPTRALQRYVRC